MLFAILDWFLRRHPSINDEVRMRARLVVGLMLFNLLTASLVTFALLLFAEADKRYTPQMLVALPPTLLFYGVSLYYFSRSLSFILTGNLFLVALAASIMSGIFITGGGNASPLVPVLVLVAVYAFLLLGQRGGLWWTGIVMAIFCVLAVIRFSGMQLPILAHPAHLVIYQTAIPIMLLFTSALALVLYEVMNSNLRRALEAERNQFAHKAAHDPLTGLANRDEFLRNLKFGINQAQSRHRHCAVVYIDLDHFKPINDRHGHAVGDHVLRAVADRLQKQVRGSDTVARLGGDEFAIVLMGLGDVEQAFKVVDTLSRAIEEPIMHDDETLSVGASYGIAIYPDMADSSAELLRLADEAMYNAKRQRKAAASTA
jgi:diguanylate cyclase (GGDEF)-like protein